MKLPTLQEYSTSRQAVEQFGGYNHNVQIGSNEFYEMENMTSAYFPALSPRKKRSISLAEGVSGILAKDGLWYTKGTTICYDKGTTVGSIDMGLVYPEHTLISMGAYIIILPEKKYINTLDVSDRGEIEKENTTAGQVRFELCRVDGTDITIKYTQSAEPEKPENGDYWIDTSSTPQTLKQYSATQSMWTTIPTTYLKIIANGIGAGINKYDGINISGLKDTELIDPSFNHFYDANINGIDGSYVVWECSADYIVIVGMLDAVKVITNPVTVARKMPDMDFIVESQNRLWGCKYGVNEKGETVNELYASKLGDFKNWSCFMGLASDSYAASVGTDGKWTGAISYMGYPLFFKENVLHKVYGNYPANFQIQDTELEGVQEGSHKSLAVVDGILFYKSRFAVMAYDGSMPSKVSEALGEVRYSDAVGGNFGKKYYISMKDDDNAYHLFVFDRSYNLWHREDNTRVNAFVNYQSELYYVDHNMFLYAIDGKYKEDATPINWSVTSGHLGADLPDKKYISKLLVRMSLELGTIVRFFIQYDSVGEWECVYSSTTTSLKSFSIPIKLRRCDHFRIKIVGRGNGRIYSMYKTIEQGSDM